MQNRNRKAMFAKRMEQNRVAHISDAIRNMEYEHGLKPMLGVKPLSREEDVELNNRLIDEQNNFNMTGQLSKKTIELLDRVPYDYRSTLLEFAGQRGALERKVVRNNRVEFEDVNRQKQFESLTKSAQYKHDVQRSRNETKVTNHHYNKKYDNYGMKK